jgi:menaquinone-dependent protoporphyrinogen oxidase
VWLFSSGPVGLVSRPSEDEAVNGLELVEQLNARGHRLFGGRLERSRLSFGERALVAALGVEDGDNRDFTDVKEWVVGIAAQLRESQAAHSSTER